MKGSSGSDASHNQYLLDLRIDGSVGGLARVFGVFAALDLAPLVLVAQRSKEGFCIQVEFCADEQLAHNCEARIARMPCAEAAVLTQPNSVGNRAKLLDQPCQFQKLNNFP